MVNGQLAQSRVGVLGSGVVGRRLAAGFSSRGHSVMIGSRNPAKPELREWLSGDGAGIEAGTFAQTAAYGELLVLAVLGNAAEQVIAATASAHGKKGPPALGSHIPLGATEMFVAAIAGSSSLGRCRRTRWTKSSQATIC